VKFDWRLWFQSLNWKLIVLRISVAAVAIALTVLIVPGISVPEYVLGTFLILGAAFGLLNAFVKPLIQVVTLPLLFVTYGLVIIVINAVMLWLLSWLFTDALLIDSLWSALFGGLVLGLLGMLMENLLGLTQPIIDDQAIPAEENSR
jgi:putative membrane protein